MHSMTGFGRGHAADTAWDVTIDVKSVNHRFLDIAMRLSNEFAFLQEMIRKEAGAYLRRGHLDVIVTLTRLGDAEAEVTVNEGVAKLYYESALHLADACNCDPGLTSAQLLRMEGVCNVIQVKADPDEVTQLAKQAMDEALEALLLMRKDEGVRLAGDLEEHLICAEQIREKILTRAPQVVVDYRQKLLTRLQAFQLENIDEARLAQEVAIMADRCAIDEELARLSSHFAQMHVYLKETGEIGKKMDFLIQEMNREANTIGSKAMDAEIAQWVVDLKSEIEKMREQVQNVE